jgi:hypothetical protein
MTSRPIARQRLGKHILAGANARNSKMSVAGKRISKRGSLTIEAVFSRLSVQSGYKESSVETPACQEMSLGAEELNCV